MPNKPINVTGIIIIVALLAIVSIFMVSIIASGELKKICDASKVNSVAEMLRAARNPRSQTLVTLEIPSCVEKFYAGRGVATVCVRPDCVIYEPARSYCFMEYDKDEYECIDTSKTGENIIFIPYNNNPAVNFPELYNNLKHCLRVHGENNHPSYPNNPVVEFYSHGECEGTPPLSYCGNNVCEASESGPGYCAGDCCGDGACQGGENIANCPEHHADDCPVLPVCRNYQDDDNPPDGKRDYPEDPGCASEQYNSESDTCPSGADCPRCANLIDDDRECSNGYDDDQDGFVDIDDPACIGSGEHTSESLPPACKDDRDNDGDGKYDIDGLDSNGDGTLDYPPDPGCLSDLDASEYNTNDPNDNGAEDDRDTSEIDYPNDTGCTSASDDSELNECKDGITNDNDSAIDFPNDLNCHDPEDNDEKSQCQDSLDNDGDEKWDFNNGADTDPECASLEDNSESS